MKIDVSKVGQLANLPLSPEEKKKFGRQLGEILDYIEKLNEVETKDVLPTSQVTGLENVTRDDVVTSSLTQEEVLENARNKHNGFFKVKAVLESV